MLEIVIDKELCTGCGYCALACPTNCIDLDYDTMKAYVTNISECIVCRTCEAECPKQIIKVNLAA